MEDSRKGEGKGPRKPGGRETDDAANEASVPAETIQVPASAAEPPVGEATPPAVSSMRQSHIDEAMLVDTLFGGGHDVAFRPLNIVLRNVRANARVLITIRDDQHATWSEGDGRGLVGLSFSTNVDPALYLSNFLINTREFFVQTYADSQEILVQLYVRTTQRDLRGRVDLPPDAVATLQSLTDRTSLVGLSAFAIDF